MTQQQDEPSGLKPHLGQPGTPGAGDPQLAPAPLSAYISAFAATDADSAAFYWPLRDGRWQRVRLTALAGKDVRVEAGPADLPFRLTARELEVLTLLAIGLSNAEIASFLVTSPRTVSTHVEHLLAKMHQTSRAGAAAMAVEGRLLRLPLPVQADFPHGLTICRMHSIARLQSGSRAEPAALKDPSLTRPGQDVPVAGSASGCAHVRPDVLRVGSAFPLGGLAGDDGQQMRNGAALAVAEINAKGGIAGRMIEHVMVDVDIFSPDGVQRAFETLFAAGVDALTSGYVFPEQVAARLAAGYGAPYVHAMTSQDQADTVRDNHAAFRNVFQVCPTEVNYGPGFVRFLDQAERAGWLPRNRRIAVVDTDMPSGLMVNPPMLTAAGQSGWDMAAARTVPAISADWAAVVGELERIDPAAIMIAQFLAGELAGFMRHASARLPGTLLYAIYAPSVPEFLRDAGPAAEGLVWATVTGTYEDSIGRNFRARYMNAYGEPPGWSHAGIAYDEVHLLAHAWRSVASPRDYAEVCRELRQLRYRGVNGAYFLDNVEQSGLSYPDTTPDPSLGQAHLVLQVQNGAHRIISPAPYAEARLAPPQARIDAPDCTSSTGPDSRPAA